MKNINVAENHYFKFMNTFRGKSIINDEWVYGYLSERIKITGDKKELVPIIQRIQKSAIISIDIFPDSIGICTGVPVKKSHRGTDFVDTLVFEHDVLMSNKTGIIVYVSRTYGMFILVGKNCDYSKLGNEIDPTSNKLKEEWEIVGNRYDYDF